MRVNAQRASSGRSTAQKSLLTNKADQEGNAQYVRGRFRVRSFPSTWRSGNGDSTRRRSVLISTMAPIQDGFIFLDWRPRSPRPELDRPRVRSGAEEPASKGACGRSPCAPPKDNTGRKNSPAHLFILVNKRHTAAKGAPRSPGQIKASRRSKKIKKGREKRRAAQEKYHHGMRYKKNRYTRTPPPLRRCLRAPSPPSPHRRATLLPGRRDEKNSRRK